MQSNTIKHTFSVYAILSTYHLFQSIYQMNIKTIILYINIFHIYINKVNYSTIIFFNTRLSAIHLNKVRPKETEGVSYVRFSIGKTI